MNRNKTIILIVGASGVGKDSLIKKAKEGFVGFNFIRRYITRVPDENEDNFFVDWERFEFLKKSGFFASSWVAHGNYYGIAKEDIEDGVNFISVSRSAIGDFESLYSNVYTIHVRVSRLELEKRLEKRGRENASEIQKRLARSYKNIDAKNLIEFDNSAALKESLDRFIKLIEHIVYKDEKVC